MKTTCVPIVFVLLLSACRVDPAIVPDLPAEGLEQVIPAGWPLPVYDFSANEISQEKFVLGRSLFYETLLSRDNTVSCGSCHQAFVAFANADHKVSHGIENKEGRRNSPGLFNLAWHPYFMHDGAVNHIEVQPLAPISNPIEMAEDINNVISKLQQNEKYRRMFTAAFGNDSVSSERMLKSLAQFMGLMLSDNSKYDRYKRGETQLSEQELRGYDRFVQKCSACHAEPLFSDFKYRNNGLSIDPVYKDGGRGELKPEEPQHRYCFKTPSLRNIALTAPYMHDGRYATLQECLDHYTGNIRNHTNLDPILEYGIQLTSGDKEDIIVFLNTLTDHSFINDDRFKDPNHH